MTWDNRALALYHGTNTHSLGSTPGIYDSITFRIDWSKCRGDADFGLGFYTTTSLHQASQWANNSVRLVPSRSAAADALVIRFDVDRDELGALDTLSFVRDTHDYYDLIAWCRMRGRINPKVQPSHARKLGKTTYDVVFGPVALGLQKLVIQGCDQVSFHTSEAAACLCRHDAIVYDRAASGTGLLP